MKRRITISILLLMALIVGMILLHAWTNTPNQESLEMGTKEQLHIIRMDATLFHLDFGRWPTNLTEFTHNEKGIVYSSQEDFLHDKWGHEIGFEALDLKRGYGRIVSFGRDGKVGGEGYDADIEVQFSENDFGNNKQEPQPTNPPYSSPRETRGSKR